MTRAGWLAAWCALALTSASAQAATPPERRVLAIVTVTLHPGKDEAFVRLLRDDIARQAKSGVKFVASYMVQFGIGNRHIVIWEGSSAEVIRRAAFEGADYPAEMLDVIEREDIEIVTPDPA